MMQHFGVCALVMFSMLVGTPAQRSPYLGSSDPGVLPQYLPEGTDNRFGIANENKEPPKMHGGTLETQDVYNRVSEWPDQHKPFWYLNAMAIQQQREREQEQQAQAAAQAQGQTQPQTLGTQNRPSPFSSSSRRNFASRQN